MKHWKKALIATSAGASVALFLHRKKTAGFLLAGVSAVALASEHAREFEALYEKFPDYVEQGKRLLKTASQIGEQVAQLAERRGMAAWEEIREVRI
ncbi:MAG TPA: hypothetical protein VH079_12455 [Terriglobales bacterium]|jgi:hypothetical protein|nr:hypothetical protein [Terriglobales bacterium]